MEIKIWDKFEYTNFLWEKAIHIVKSILEDSEWKLIIAEDWEHYWYIWERDKKILN